MFENNMLENIQSMRLVNPENDWHNLVTPAFKQFLDELAGKETTNDKEEN